TCPPWLAAVPGADRREGFLPAAVAAASSGLNWLFTPAVFLDLVVQRDAVDIELFGGTSLLPATFLQGPENVRFFDVLRRLRRSVGHRRFENKILLAQLPSPAHHQSTPHRHSHS